MSGLALLPPYPLPSWLTSLPLWDSGSPPVKQGGWTGGFQGLFKPTVWPWDRPVVLWASETTSSSTIGWLAS